MTTIAADARPASAPASEPTSKPPRRRRRTRWSFSIGARGETVCAFAERNHRLYGVVGGRAGRRVALRNSKSEPGWRDTPENRERAITWAKEQHKRLTDGLLAIGDLTPTCARVFAAYTAARAARDRDTLDDHRCTEMFTWAFGADRDLSKLTITEWEAFVHARQTGAITPHGEPVPAPATPDDPPRRPVRPRTVAADCAWLAQVCAWAVEADDRQTGQPLLRAHPLKRQRFRAAVPQEANPRCPVATQDRLEALLAVADQVHPFLASLLQLVNGTARRISAILALRYQDLKLARTAATPHGAIAWPGDSDKRGKAWAAPLNATVRATLDALLAERPGLGSACLFPSPKDAAKPMDRWFASKLLRQAERLAKLPHLEQGCWHPFRRKWATERKHLPVQDVAQAGGWSDLATLQEIYQQPDEGMLLHVVENARELREGHA